MDYLDLSLPDPPANLALEEALLLEAEEGRLGEVLRVWEMPRLAVVLGSGGVLSQDADEPACLADDVPILRRCSGGGAVLLGPGCLCYSLILDATQPPLNDIRSSYQFILDRMTEALKPLGLKARAAGCSDLAVGDVKISGNSQRRMRSFLLHHGTLLYGMELERMERYLRQPVRQPSYRRRRDHRAFVQNLAVSADQLRAVLRQGWGAGHPLAEWPQARTAQLLAEKYACPEWNRRR